MEEALLGMLKNRTLPEEMPDVVRSFTPKEYVMTLADRIASYYQIMI